MGGVGDTEKWYQSYKDRANFLLVYVEEAHPGTLVDGQQILAPQSYDERHGLAEMCVSKKSLTLPAVVDNLDNAVELSYAAFPDRIYVLDPNGIVRYKTEPGPRGWDVKGPKAALDAVLKHD